MPDLSWRHHAIIQATLSRGPLKEEDFHATFEGITGKNPRAHQQLFNDCLGKINKELAYVQFELRACRNQYDGDVYYGVVNNVVDEQSKLGTKYSVPQIAFYKCIIESVAQDPVAQGCVSSLEALNMQLENQLPSGQGSQSQSDPAYVPPAFKNFSVTQKQKTLDELVRDRWLSSTPDGKIGLGVRSFLDLRSWFRNNEVPSCDVCNEAGVKAELCQNDGCMVRIHEYCLKKKFARRAQKVCPGCGAQWHYSVSKMEVLDEEDGPAAVNHSQLPPKPSARKKLRSCKAEDVTAGESSPSQGGAVPVPILRRSTRSSSRLK